MTHTRREGDLMAKRRQGYGKGSIYRTKDRDGNPSGWMVQVRVNDPFKPNGRLVRRRARTYDDAIGMLETLQSDAATRLPADAAMRITDYLDVYMRDTLPTSGVSERTVDIHKTLIANPIKPTLGEVTFKELTPATAQAWLARLNKARTVPAGEAKTSKSLAGSTLHKAFYVLAKALDVAERDGLLAENPLRKLKPPRAQRAIVPTTSATDFDNVIVPAVTGTRLEPLVVFIGLTGCRLGEALGLRWDDVDLARATATFRRSGATTDRTKTGQVRTVPLVPEVVDALKLRRKVQREDKLAMGSGWQNNNQLVFTTFEGRPMDPHNARRDFKAMLKRHDLSTARPFHSLRHGLATRLLQRGIPMHVVGAILGHSSIKLTVDTYGHVEPVMHAEALATALGPIAP